MEINGVAFISISEYSCFAVLLDVSESYPHSSNMIVVLSLFMPPL